MSDVDEVTRVIRQWANNAKRGCRDEVLSGHAESVVIFDVLPPMKYEGKAAYQKSWDEWQPDTKGDSIFELHDLEVVAGGDVAFAYGFIHCGGVMKDGSTFENWVRATFCLEKKGGEWLVTHQHVSMPRS